MNIDTSRTSDYTMQMFMNSHSGKHQNNVSCSNSNMNKTNSNDQEQKSIISKDNSQMLFETVNTDKIKNKNLELVFINKEWM